MGGRGGCWNLIPRPRRRVPPDDPAVSASSSFRLCSHIAPEGREPFVASTRWLRRAIGQDAEDAATADAERATENTSREYRPGGGPVGTATSADEPETAGSLSGLGAAKRNGGTALGGGGGRGGRFPVSPARGAPRRQCGAVIRPVPRHPPNRSPDRPARAGPYSRKPFTLQRPAPATSDPRWSQSAVPFSHSPGARSRPPRGRMSLIPSSPHPFPLVLDACLPFPGTGERIDRPDRGIRVFYENRGYAFGVHHNHPGRGPEPALDRRARPARNDRAAQTHVRRRRA